MNWVYKSHSEEESLTASGPDEMHANEGDYLTAVGTQIDDSNMLALRKKEDVEHSLVICDNSQRPRWTMPTGKGGRKKR